MSTRWLNGLVWSICAAVALTLGCGQEVQEIRIGEYSSLTGDKATFGQSTTRGIALAIEEANTAGGVGGVALHVITEDDQGKPEEAATAVNKLVTQNQVITVIGEVASSNSLAGAPICQDNRVPMISPASTNPAVTEVGDYIFRVCFIDPFQGTVMARFAAQTLGLKRVGILRDVRSDYSVGLATFFTEEFTRLGGTIVGDESYQQGDVDFKAPLTALINRQPEGIFIPGYYTEVGLVARQARELQYKGPLMGGDGWDSPKLVEIGGEAIEGAYFSNHYSVEDPAPEVQSFVQRFKQKFGSAPDAIAACGYDAARLLAEKLRALHQEDAQLFETLVGGAPGDAKGRQNRQQAMARMRDLIAGTKEFHGVTGVITLDAQRNAQKPAVVLQVQGGKYTFVTRVEA